MTQWYEQLFSNYARTYEKEEFTKGTEQEVRFIDAEFKADRIKRVLDIGCGTGRHAIGLANLGYQVTGIDLSETQLKWARSKAELAGATVTFLQKDARNFQFTEPFDAAIMICEGAFSLMETDEMNFKIIQNTYQALKKGGAFIFTCLNALFPLFHSVKDFLNLEQSQVYTKENTFDIMTFRDYSVIEAADDDGQKKVLHCNERYYAPSEIRWMLESLGFSRIEIFGCDTGKFCREIELTPDHFEMLVIAKK